MSLSYLEKNKLLANDGSGNMVTTILFVIGNLLLLGFFIVPLIQITKLYKGGIKAKDAPLLLLFAIIFNCILWLLNAFSSDSITPWLPLIVSNIGGLAINLALLFFFLYVVLRKKKITKFLGLGLFSLNLIIEFSYLIFRYVITKEKNNSGPTFYIIGYVATFVNLLMYFSPATNIKTVLRTGRFDPLTLVSLELGCGATFVLFIQSIIMLNVIDEGDDIAHRNAIEMLVANLVSFILLVLLVVLFLYSKAKHPAPKIASDEQINNDLNEGLANAS